MSSRVRAGLFLAIDAFNFKLVRRLRVRPSGSSCCSPTQGSATEPSPQATLQVHWCLAKFNTLRLGGPLCIGIIDNRYTWRALENTEQKPRPPQPKKCSFQRACREAAFDREEPMEKELKARAECDRKSCGLYTHPLPRLFGMNTWSRFQDAPEDWAHSIRTPRLG